MHRHTFVVQVHPGGLSTLENLSTQERVRIAEMAAVGPQIDQWLEALRDAEERSGAAEGGARSG